MFQWMIGIPAENHALARPLRVVVLAPVHPWDDSRVFQKEARALALAGYRVTLVAQAETETDIEGVHVVPAARSRSRVYRFAKLAGLALTALKMRADVYHLHNPDTAPIALVLKLSGRRVIYDTHEDFRRRLLMRRWLPKMLRPAVAGAVGVLEYIVSRCVDASIATQPEVVARMGARAVLILNAPWSEGVLISEAHAQAEDLVRGPELRAVHVGSHIDGARGLFTMVEALEHVNEQTDCRLWLVGEISDSDLSVARQMPGWEYVDYVGRTAQPTAFAHIVRSDVGLVTIHDIGDHRDSSANKLHEYQSFGCPFVASAFPRWIDHVGKSTSGLFVQPGDANALASALVWLAVHPEERRCMGERGCEYIRRQFCWEQESTKLLAVYRRVVGSEPT